MHSDITRDTGSTATETGRLRYCIRGVSLVAIVTMSRGADVSIAPKNRSERIEPVRLDSSRILRRRYSVSTHDENVFGRH